MDAPESRRPDASLPRVLVMANQKGGVGKTTTAINLGTALAAIGERVLIIDLDPQGNASTGLGIDRKSRVTSSYDMLVGERALRDVIIPTAVPRLFTRRRRGNGAVLGTGSARSAHTSASKSRSRITSSI